MMENIQERRTHPRVVLDPSASIDILFTGPIFTGLLDVHNISLGGIRFEMLELFDDVGTIKLNTEINFILTLGDGIPFRGNGMIRYTEKTGKKSGIFGVEFMDLDEEDEADIENFINIQKYHN